MTSLYIPEDGKSIYQEYYNFLYKCLKKIFENEVMPEMVESFEWKLTPTGNGTVKMKHKENLSEDEAVIMFFGYYDPESEVFTWHDLEVKNIIKNFIEENYEMSVYLGSASCLLSEIFSDNVSIRNDDHVIIPTFIRMFFRSLRLVRSVTNDNSDKKYYYALIEYNFKDHTNFSKFEIILSLYKESISISL